MKYISKIIVNILMLALLLICLLPFWWTFTMSTVDNGTLFSTLPMVPGNKFFENINMLFQQMNVGRAFANSAIVAISSTLMNLFFSALAAFAFSKYRFRGKEILFLLVMITMFIPGQLSWIGFVQEMKGVGLIDTLWPLILPNFGTAFGIFIIRGYINESLPDSLIDAARIDGCKDFSTDHDLTITTKDENEFDVLA